MLVLLTFLLGLWLPRMQARITADPGEETPWPRVHNTRAPAPDALASPLAPIPPPTPWRAAFCI